VAGASYKIAIAWHKHKG